MPGMADATVVAAGEVNGIERTGRGRATLHRLPDGSAFLRLDDFEVSQNTDLFMWLSEAVGVRSSELRHLMAAGLRRPVMATRPSGDRPGSTSTWCSDVRKLLAWKGPLDLLGREDCLWCPISSRKR